MTSEKGNVGEDESRVCWSCGKRAQARRNQELLSSGLRKKVGLPKNSNPVTTVRDLLKKEKNWNHCQQISGRKTNVLRNLR